ncbi:peptide chain release factor N(5)-glutamine methyltransferase [Gemella sp. Musashino-2025]
MTKACFLLRKHAKEESLARFLLMYLVDENSSTFNKEISSELDKKTEEEYFNLINKHIAEDIPLSHLTGFEYFYNRKFKVTSDVLSPRMETEELVDKIIDYVKKQKLYNIKILDLCTGSGIIAITLQKEISEHIISIVGSDISSKALNIAQLNSVNLKSDVKFINSDLFEKIEDKFDIIVSNPPYIAYSDKITLKKDVLNFDPHLSLFAEEDGMYFYRKIIEQANHYLTDQGVIFFEIGYNQKDKIVYLAKQTNYRIQVLKDINGRDRIAILYK